MTMIIKAAAIVVVLYSPMIFASLAMAGRSERQRASIYPGYTRAQADVICGVFGTANASCDAALGDAMEAQIYESMSSDAVRDPAGSR